jgi:PAS domain S-box-containing protein
MAVKFGEEMTMRRKGRPETQGWGRRNTYLLVGVSLWSVVMGAALGKSLMLDQQDVLARSLAAARMACQALTLVNPDLMARGGHFVGKSVDGPRGHITSLDPVSPKNQPDDWEIKALHSLAAGAAETSEVTDIDGRSHLRLMRPLIIEQDCLQCHTGQGYKVGDMRGGISVDVPIAALRDTARAHFRAAVAGYGVIWLTGLSAVALAALTIQRRGRERARREAEFRKLFDEAPVAYHEIDRDSVIRRVNRTECTLLGYVAGEMLGRPIWAFIAEAEREVSRETIRRKLAGVEPLAPFQRRFVRRDGGELLLEIHETLVRNAAGEATGLRSALLNITERQQAEDALREAARQWQTTFDAVNDAVCLLDADGRILRCNRAMAALIGGVPADLIGRRCWEVVHGVPEPIPGCPLLRMRTSHRREQLELQLGDSWFNVTADPILDERQALQGMIHVIRDITEHKQVEAALIRQARIAAIFASTPDDEMFNEVVKVVLDVMQSPFGVFGYIDEDGALVVPTMTRQVWSECAVADKIIRFPRDAWSDSSWPRAIREKRANYSNEVSTGVPEGHVGIRRHISLPIMFQEEVIGLFQVANKETDYTEQDVRTLEAISGQVAPILQARLWHDRASRTRERMEARLLQTKKMESIGRLAGGVAHDFNNLLTVINGYSKLLLGKLSAGDPLRVNLEQINEAGERAAKLTSQLLAFSRKQLLAPRVVDLNHLVGQMRSMLEPLVGEDVEVRVELNSETGMVRADPHQLEQVIMNLVVNSRDAMPRGGKLLIETACVEFDESYARSHPEVRLGRHVLLAVSDNGMGMDDETRRQIFEPFFTTKGAGRGTGLGLSMVQGIVAQSGGYSDVYSEPGHGTTFKIYLPRVEEAVADTRIPETVPDLGGKETVLVVEDHAEVREYAVAVLKAYGYRIIQAESAGQALLMLEREPERIDLLLTDVVMPSVGGRELADRLERLQPGIKVLFMSGYTDNVIVHHGVLDEGAHFIQKPFSPEKLGVKVREVLGPSKLLARILVADDEAGVRSFLRAALEQGGYEVTEAADGKQVLKQVRAERVDLVITDIIMPEQEGIETIRALRKEAPGIRIIAISGAFDGLYLEVAEMLGADAVLAKPVTAQLLLARVAEVLKSRR